MKELSTKDIEQFKKIVANSSSKSEIIRRTNYSKHKVNKLLKELEPFGVKLTSSCLHCGKELIKKPNGSAKKYCDYKCYVSHNLFSVTCKGCNRVFKAPKGTVYCSLECKQQRVPGTHKRTCTWCNKEYFGHGNSLYCSSKCLNAATRSRKNSSLLTCDICGSEYVGSKDNQYKICSIECRNILSKKKADEVLLEVFGTVDTVKIRSLMKERMALYE